MPDTPYHPPQRVTLVLELPGSPLDPDQRLKAVLKALRRYHMVRVVEVRDPPEPAKEAPRG